MTHFANYTHGHHAHLNDEGFDLDFIEAAHYDRERNMQMGSPAQFPLGGASVIEHFAPKDVTVLAYPVLFCLGCTIEHPCAYTHKIASDMGTCTLERVKDVDSYVPSERVTITAERTYTGRIQRKESV